MYAILLCKITLTPFIINERYLHNERYIEISRKNLLVYTYFSFSALEVCLLCGPTAWEVLYRAMKIIECHYFMCLLYFKYIWKIPPQDTQKKYIIKFSQNSLNNSTLNVNCLHWCMKHVYFKIKYQPTFYKHYIAFQGWLYTWRLVGHTL